ncbi:hypothetical protein ACFE04_020401 [Oxalis oulophora]
MEFSAAFQASPWHYLLTSHVLFHHRFVSENYVQWTQTPDSHNFSADLSGVRKEEIKVEVEDSKYLIIRTESIDESSSTRPEKRFMRKFRLPRMVDVEGISAAYEDGVLTITVPRILTFIHPEDVHQNLQLIARAA